MGMKEEHIVHPFAPVYDENSRILILGSFPSVVSRRQNFYYANPSNRFWKVLAELFQEEIKDKKQFCLDHHIALWDVIRSCRIRGSSDASITDVTVNPVAGLCRDTKIRTVFTTGRKASDLYDRYIDCPLPHIALPSTSGANASMRMPDLCRAYQIILETLNEKD